jgi:hypothetical protein
MHESIRAGKEQNDLSNKITQNRERGNINNRATRIYMLTANYANILRLRKKRTIKAHQIVPLPHHPSRNIHNLIIKLNI